MHFCSSAITQDKWDKSGFGCVHLGKNNRELIFALSCPTFNETLWKKSLSFFNAWLDKPNINLEIILGLWNNLFDENKINELSAYCLCGEDNDVAFSLIGEAGLYFLQTTSLSPIIEGKQPKRFTQIFRGNILQESLLIGGTYAMMRLIPQETVKELFRRSHGQNECLRLSQEMSRRYDFALPLLTVTVSPEPAQAFSLPQFNQPQVVVETTKPLYESNRQFNQQLPPRSRLLNKNNIIIAWPKIIAFFNYLKVNTPKVINVLKLGAKAVMLGLLYVYIFIKLLSKQILVGLVALTRLFKLLINKNLTWVEKKNELIIRLSHLALTIKNKFLNLPRTYQFSLFAGLIIIILLTVSLATLIQNKKNQWSAEQVNSLLSQIESKKTSAEAALIYDDNERAHSLVTEALALAETLPKTNNAQTEQYNFYLRDLNSLLLKTEKMITLSAPTQIYALSENAPPFWSLTRGNLVGLDPNSGKIFIYNIKNKTLQTNQAETLKDSVALINDDQNLLVLKAQEVYSLNLSPFKTEKIELLKNETSPFVTGAIYSKRLYALLENTPKILRFDKTLAGYGKSQLWGNQTYNVIRAGQSLAVDGSLYILTNNGSIYNCQAGNCLEMSIKTVNLKELKPDIISASLNSKNLYLFAKKAKRIILLNKLGAVIAQYSSPSWQNLQAFQIDEVNKKIYVIADNNIYVLSL